MTATNKFLVVKSKQWISGTEKLWMKYNLNIYIQLTCYFVFLLVISNLYITEKSRKQKVLLSNSLYIWKKTQQMSTCHVIRNITTTTTTTVLRPFIRDYPGEPIPVTYNINGIMNRTQTVDELIFTLTRSWWLLKSWQRLKAHSTGSMPSSIMLCVQIGGNVCRCKETQHHQLTIQK